MNSVVLIGRLTRDPKKQVARFGNSVPPPFAETLIRANLPELCGKKCKECEHEEFQECNGSPNRYYCTHPIATKEVNAGARMISKTERHSTERKHKTAPKWCPLKKG